MSEISEISSGYAAYFPSIDFNGERDKYIGLALAISSSLAIGTSFIITKKGLIDAADRHEGYSSDSYSYLKNGIWWAGMILMVVGEVANFAAYTFAPPILVTPLGALSVLIGAILASVFLNETLGKIGRAGCSLCLVGSIIIVLHAPEDKEITTVDEMLGYALQPGFMIYCLFVLSFCLYMIYKVAPVHGTRNPMVYISICSLVGSISVMAVKGFGIALKLTFAGNNQLWRAGTWVFAFVVVGCIGIQMNYFNKALDLFSTNVVNPIYYVCFSTSTIIASIILFQGLNTTGGSNTFSLLCGFYIISLGVYLLNISRSDPDGTSHHHSGHTVLETGVLGSRLSMTASRLSMTSDNNSSSNLPLHTRNNTLNNSGRGGAIFDAFEFDEGGRRGAERRTGVQGYGHGGSREELGVVREEEGDTSEDEMEDLTEEEERELVRNERKRG